MLISKAGMKAKVKPKEFFINHKNYIVSEGIVEYGYHFCSEMWNLCGKIVHIKDASEKYIYLEEDHYTYEAWMLEELIEDGNFLLDF